ncbi:MAG: GDSL-type esterase/lipase family protein [Oscillospiraceae bacterium]|nr:GDSL-type esterase/lipase family protein [Oscillospiraceae bacterium]
MKVPNRFVCVGVLAVAAIASVIMLSNSSDFHKAAVSASAEATTGSSAASVSSVAVSSRMTAVSSASVPSAVQKKASSVKAKPAAVSAAPTAAGGLKGAALVGNSCVEGLAMQDVLPEADFYARVGLTVQTAFTKTAAGGTQPVMQALGSKKYSKVLLEFGENELGWGSTQAFYNAYAKLVDYVKKVQPGAKVYIQSILPVSAAVSQRNVDQENNRRIEEYNALLQKLAKQEGAVYLDAASVMKDADGCLPNDAAEDGIHLNRKYCGIWADYLKKHC